MRKSVVVLFLACLVSLAWAAPKVNMGKVKKMAAKGDLVSQNALGMAFLSGRGAVKNPVEAYKWFNLSAKQGYPPAMTNLGWMLEMGQGVHKDERLAAGWYLMAAKKGNAMAQYNLGLMYEAGRGVAKDMNEAFAWYKQAALQGNKAAQGRAVSLQQVLAKSKGGFPGRPSHRRWPWVVLILAACAGIGGGYYLGHVRHEKLMADAAVKDRVTKA
jgi:TPR repeat protein